MDEHEHSADSGPSEAPEDAESPESPESPEDAEASVTSPMTGPAGEQPGRRRRAEHARKVLTSRGAGWVVATALAGAVVALSVILATASPATVVPVRLAGPAFLRPAVAGPVHLLPASAQQVQAPPGVQVPAWVIIGRPAGQLRVHMLAPACRVHAGAQVQLPTGAQVQLPPRARVHVSAGGRVQLPPGSRIQVPAAVRIQVTAPARAATPAGQWVILRQGPGCLPAPAG